MKSPSVKRFVIRRLFGHKDVELNFKNQVQIYIGENGLGKTTVLNALYYVISVNFEKLSRINFSEIEIEFKNKKYCFSKPELDAYLESTKEKGSNFYDYLKNNINDDLFKEIKKLLSVPNRKEIDSRFEIVELLKNKGININGPTNYIYQNIIRLVNEKGSSTDFNEFISTIKTEVSSKILYFPTYRRIEEELQNIGNYIERKDNVIRRRMYGEVIEFEEDNNTESEEINQIQFGMKDVEKRIKSITNTITQSSVSGFAKVTGDMLSQLLKGYPNGRSIGKINKENIKIILGRIGKNLSQEDKDNIINLISTNKLYSTENKQLIYFLDQLLKLYQSQLEFDTAIKNFKDVCNGYLVDKHYEYDESAVDLRIFRNTETKEEVLLHQLSSGEKQIVSLFSKIYLEPENNFIVLFDEPELSLSIFWQKKLLPDILMSKRCEFLLAVTHSPFIFDNDLKSYTIGLKEFIRNSQSLL